MTQNAFVSLYNTMCYRFFWIDKKLAKQNINDSI